MYTDPYMCNWFKIRQNMPMKTQSGGGPPPRGRASRGGYNDGAECEEPERDPQERHVGNRALRDTAQGGRTTSCAHESGGGRH